MNKLSVVHTLPLSLGCNAKFGYYIQMAVPRQAKFDISILPKELKVVKQTGSTIFITTEELEIAGQRCRDIGKEIHIMSNMYST